MTLAILFSLKIVELLENGLQPHSGVTLLLSMRTELLVSSQSCCSVDPDAWSNNGKGPEPHVDVRSTRMKSSKQYMCCCLFNKSLSLRCWIQLGLGNER